MKKILSLILAVLLTFTLVACGNGNSDNNKVTIGVSPVPHEEIAKVAKEILAKDGITLEIKVFDDYVQPNLAVKDGELDANFFQHVPYLTEFNKANNTNIVPVGNVHVEPIAFYSTKVDSLDKLADGAEIIIPNDPSNGARALKLLANNNLIKLDESVDLPTVKNITENTKNIKFTEIEAALIAGAYKEVDGAVINSNYAIGANLNPVKDGIVIEGSESDYANVIAVNKDRENDEIIKKVLSAFQSEEVKKLLEEKFDGAVVPAFK